MFKISYDKKITMVQGDTGVIRMRIHNYELSQGDEVRFAIVNKANPSILLCQHSDKKIVLEKQVTVFEKDGSARIVIYPYDTEYLQPGKYLYEIQVKTKDGRIDTVVQLTSFTLMDGAIEGEYGQTTPSKPEPTPSEIELRFKRLENEIIPELGNRITNVEKEIDGVSSSLDNMMYIVPNANGIDDTENIQKTLNNAGVYKKIIIPYGEYIISESITPLEGQTIEFFGEIKLKSKNVVYSMLSISKPNITLINPKLNMDSVNNINSGTKGQQTIISCYSNGYNLSIIGGKLINGIHNGVQGGRSGLKIDGTRFENFGEHAIYLSGMNNDKTEILCNGFTLNSLYIKNVGLDESVNYAHGIKLRGVEYGKVKDCYIDCMSNNVDSFFFEIAESSNNIEIIGCIGVNSTHKFLAISNDCDYITITNSKFKISETNVRSATFSSLPYNKEIKINGCEFIGYNLNGQIPKFLHDCSLTKIPYGIDITDITDSEIKNCTFDFTNASRSVMAQIHSIDGNLKFINCNFIKSNTQTTGINVANINNIDIEMCTFNSCANATIQVSLANRCFITNNKLIDSEGSASAIKVKEGVLSGALFGNILLKGGILNNSQNVINMNN